MKPSVFFNFVLMFIVSCAIFLASCSVNQEDSGWHDEAGAHKAPDFTLNDLAGESVSSVDFFKKSNVLLIFTTTWCPRCVTVIPDLKSIYSKYKDKNFKMLSVYVREAHSKVAESKAKYGVPYSILLDSDGEVALSYGVRGVPTFIFVDRNGSVKYSGHSIPKDIIDRKFQE